MLNLACNRNSPDRSTKSTPSHFNVLRLLVNTGFQVLFHSPPGVLFTFPSRYFFSIGHQVVFSLGRWSSLLPTGFLVSHGTLGVCFHLSRFRLQDFHLLRLSFPAYSATFTQLLFANPSTPIARFGLFPFRSPLLRKSMFLSFPQGT